MLQVPYDPKDRRGSALRLLDKLDRLNERELAEIAVHSGMNPFEFMMRVAALRIVGQELIAQHVGN